MHTASLFPGADRLADALDDDAPILVPMRGGGAPEARVTLSARVLKAALSTHIVITGAAKREALEKAQTLPVEEAPVRAVLSGRHGALGALRTPCKPLKSCKKGSRPCPSGTI